MHSNGVIETKNSGGVAQPLLQSRSAYSMRWLAVPKSRIVSICKSDNLEELFIQDGGRRKSTPRNRIKPELVVDHTAEHGFCVACNTLDGRRCKSPTKCLHVNRTTGDGICIQEQGRCKSTSRNRIKPELVVDRISEHGFCVACNALKGRRRCKSPTKCLHVNRTTGDGI
jgi:hypothetical protein